ncbi:hypothetical protein AMECASPLE_021773 [Ameca splendens]|uniref:Uncharacterized protein n=1 Tax=Ameca splendens TaxID=208324 RepID=A0ABV0Z3K2_9TELE
MVPTAGGVPTGGWPRVSRSGWARLGPARSNLATRCSPTSPNPRPGSRWDPGSAVPGDVTCLDFVVLMKASCYKNLGSNMWCYMLDQTQRIFLYFYKYKQHIHINTRDVQYGINILLQYFVVFTMT